MLRYRLINPHSLTALILCCALGSGAFAADQTLLKIDITTQAASSYPGWTSWLVDGGTIEATGFKENTFPNGIKVGFKCPWYSVAAEAPQIDGYSNPNWGAFSGDIATVMTDNFDQGDLNCVISYLSPGNYTLTTYHNPRLITPALNKLMDVNDRVGTGAWTRKHTNFQQCNWSSNDLYVLANGACSMDFTIPQPNMTYEVAYKTSYKEKNPPADMNMATDWIRNVGIAGFQLVAHEVYAAYNPYPLPDSTIRYNTTYNFSWATPDVYQAGAQHYDLYFSTAIDNLRDPATGDPCFPVDKCLVSYAVQSGTMSYPVPALLASKNYYWRVDSYGMKDGNPDYKTVGVIWHFDTNNQAPAVTLGLGQASYPGRMVNLTATATDLDELPAGRTITYYWDYQVTSPLDPIKLDPNKTNDPNYNVRYSDVFRWTANGSLPGHAATLSIVLDPNEAHVGTSGLTYTFRCVVGDGNKNTTKDIKVFVANKTRCELARGLENYTQDVTFEGVLYPTIKSIGDINDDCITDIKDVSLYVSQWLGCQAVNNLCL